MNISSNLSSASVDPGQQISEFWWSIDIETGKYSCSDLFLHLCGIETDHFTAEDLLSLVDPSQKDSVEQNLVSFGISGFFEDKFIISTKNGPRWIYAKLDSPTMGTDGNRIAKGSLCFWDDQLDLTYREIATKSRFNELISRYSAVSESLMELLNSSDISGVILKTLNNLLDEFQGDRAYIFEYDKMRSTQSCVYEVVRDAVESTQQSLQKIPLTETKWWTEMLLNRCEPIIYDHIEELKIHAPEEYDILSAQNIQSVMVVPLITKNGVGGYLGIDMVRKQHSWTQIDREWFKSLANVIGLCAELKKSEKKAQRDREYSNRLHENMPIGFIRIKVVYDNNGIAVDYVHLEMNTLACTLSETQYGSVVNRSARELDIDQFESRLARFDHIIKDRSLERGREASLGGDRHWDYTIYSVEGDEIIVLLQDNTESILSSRALRKSEETLRNLYKNLPVGVEIYNKDGILISINDKEQEMFGFKNQEDVLGINLFDNPNLPSAFLDDLRNGTPSCCEFYYNFEKLTDYYSSACMGQKHIVLKGTILYDVDHNVENYLLIVLDNTDSLQANHKIHEFEVLFNSIAQFAEVGLCQWNPSKNTIFGTDQWYYNLGQDNRKVTDVMEAYSNAHAADIVRLKQCFEDIISGRTTSFREEIRILNSDGQYKWLRTNYKVSARSLPGSNIEIIGINIDITELKNTELKLIQAKLKAEESDRLKSAFLANMSHEIRTPLNAIVGFSDLLVDVDDVQEREQYMSIIRQNNDLLLQLISDILDISKIESGVVDVNIEQVSVNAMCDEIVCSQSMKTSGGVQLIFQAPSTDVVIMSDKNRLRQMLSNLVGNAFKFTKQGTITIGYTIKDSWVEFFVKDTGIGISEEAAQTVFTRFVKLNTFIPGTGLGLSICKSLVEKLGGEIWVEAELGVGSCFYFTLPCENMKSKNDMNSDEPQEVDNMTKETNTTLMPNGEKPLILVAEDTDSNYLLVSTILKQQYTLVRACTGREAVEMFKAKKPQLILMDMKMPEMDGLQATAQILAIDPQMPIIMLTAFAYDNDKTKAMEVGCCDFITKPIHLKELKEVVSKYILQP